MVNNTVGLPPLEELNISALSRLFRDTTNSYKYILFLSFLDILARRKFDASLNIEFRDLIIEMLANAWYSHTYFKLSFGKQDQIGNKLNSLKSKIEIVKPILYCKDDDKICLRETIATQNLNDRYIKDIMRYVPYLLIRPFLDTKLNRESKQTPERQIPRLSRENFEICKPLYCFDSDLYVDCKSIIPHPKWVSYIKTNYSIVRAGVSWEWLKYMQSRNPSVPAIANKLFPPQERGDLSMQRSYWIVVLRHSDIKCIYSKIKLNPTKFSLDHYLPWSFVTHDLLWNLIPTLPEINSSKSNKLPASKYFYKFILLQHQGLKSYYEQMGENKWLEYVEPYMSELKISDKEELLDLEKLTRAYESTVLPLVSLATHQGFDEWSNREYL